MAATYKVEEVYIQPSPSYPGAYEILLDGGNTGVFILEERELVLMRNAIDDALNAQN